MAQCWCQCLLQGWVLALGHSSLGEPLFGMGEPHLSGKAPREGVNRLHNPWRISDR